MRNGFTWQPPNRVTMDSTRPERLLGESDPWRGTVITDVGARNPEPISDDPAVVRAVLAGDRDAFRVLVDRESAAVVRVCHRVLGDLGEAEDVAQEAFVIAYRSLATWRAEGPFGAWISRIAVRLAIRRATRHRTIGWAHPGPAGEDGRIHDPMANLAAGTSSDPESTTLRGERQRAVRMAVAGLAEPYREVVALRFFAERSLDEIATVTGRPLGTVKTHLHRGLLRLRGSLAEVEP